MGNEQALKLLNLQYEFFARKQLEQDYPELTHLAGRSLETIAAEYAEVSTA